MAEMNYRRHEASMEGELRRLFRRQAAQARQRILGKQARKGTRYWPGDTEGKMIDPLRVFDPKRWETETRDMLGGVLYDITDQTGKAFFDTFREPAKAAVPAGAAFNVHNPEVSNALDRRVNRITNINNTTADAIRSELIAGEANGEGINALASRVQGVFDDASRTRAMTIARTEVVGAVNEGNVFAAKQTGLQLTKQWLTAIDNRTREAHAEADGQEVPIDKSFVVGGEEMDYPGDPFGSTENTVNCRCTVIYNGDALSLAPSENEVFDDAPPPDPVPEILPSTAARPRQTGTTSHTDKHYVTSDYMNQTKIKALLKELDAQGFPDNAPIRAVVSHSQSMVAVSRGIGGDRITGAIAYFHGTKADPSTLVHDLRAVEQGSGAGTALMAHVAREGVAAGNTEMAIYGAVQNALPFYANMGGVPLNPDNPNSTPTHWDLQGMIQLGLRCLA